MVGKIQHSETTCRDTGRRSQFMGRGVGGVKRPQSRGIGEYRVGMYGEGGGYKSETASSVYRVCAYGW